jgi:hypothetical protein
VTAVIAEGLWKGGTREYPGLSEAQSEKQPETEGDGERREMKIIVVGNGKIGFLLTRQLSEDGHDIVVIDHDPQKLFFTKEKLDVRVLVGNGASIDVLREAEAGSSDLLIAVTNSDEVNLLTALIADKLGCRSTVARVRNQEYDKEMNLLKSSFGLSLAINPEKTCAKEIFRLLQFPSFLTRSSFADGKAEMVELIVTEESRLSGKRLEQISAIFNKKALICTVDRGGEVFVPSGNMVLQAGDKLSLSSATADLPFLLSCFGIKSQGARKVMLVGGSATAVYLADYLLRAGMEVRILEIGRERCEKLVETLPRAEVICGDGSLQEVLDEEGIGQMDAIVPLTGIDEENIMISLYARSIGVKKTVTKVNRMEYLNLVGDVNVGAVASPKLLTANEITRYVRAVGQSREGSVETLYTLSSGMAEALGFTVPDSVEYLNRPIMELKLKKAILIASIVRNQRVIIPSGQDVLMGGDSIVVIADPRRKIANLTDIFLENGGVS